MREGRWHLRRVPGLESFLAYSLPDPEHSVPTRSLLVIGYLLAAVAWFLASRQARATAANTFARWWAFGAILLVLLAINKQFNLRGHIEDGFRAVAKAGNWYDRRQPVQFALAILLPSLLALVAGILLVTKARRFFRAHPVALLGWVMLVVYLALRQSQEWRPMFDTLIRLRYRDWRLAVEIIGMVLVAATAVLACRPASSGAVPKDRPQDATSAKHGS